MNRFFRADIGCPVKIVSDSEGFHAADDADAAASGQGRIVGGFHASIVAEQCGEINAVSLWGFDFGGEVM